MVSQIVVPDFSFLGICVLGRGVLVDGGAPDLAAADVFATNHRNTVGQIIRKQTSQQILFYFFKLKLAQLSLLQLICYFSCILVINLNLGRQQINCFNSKIQMGGCAGTENKPQNQPLRNRQAQNKKDLHVDVALSPKSTITEKNSPVDVNLEQYPQKHFENLAPIPTIDNRHQEPSKELQAKHEANIGNASNNLADPATLPNGDLKLEDNRSPIKVLEEANPAEQIEGNQDELKSLSEHSHKKEGQQQGYQTHQKGQSKINIIYSPDVELDPEEELRRKRIEATDKRYEHLTKLKAVSEAPSFVEDMSSRKGIGPNKDKALADLAEEERQRLLQQSAPAFAKTNEAPHDLPAPDKEVKPFQGNEERVHGEEQFLEAFHQVFELPIFEIAIGS